MIEKLLVGLALGILQFLAQRRDQRNAAQAEVYREAWTLAKKAYEWETTAVRTPDGGATLRVRDGAGPIQLHREGPSPNGSTPPSSV